MIIAVSRFRFRVILWEWETGNGRSNMERNFRANFFRGARFARILTAINNRRDVVGACLPAASCLPFQRSPSILGAARRAIS